MAPLPKEMMAGNVARDDVPLPPTVPLSHTPADAVAPAVARYESPVPTEVLDTAPAWFRTLCETPKESRYLEVDGYTVHYLHWANPDLGSSAPGLVFLPGLWMSAHAYDFIAPYFLQFGFQVAVIDFTGQGEADHRTDASYGDSDGIAGPHLAEVEAVLRDAKFPPRPYVVGHSWGGWLAHLLAQRNELGGIVNVDCFMWDPAWEKDPKFVSNLGGKRPSFKSYEVALDKFGFAHQKKQNKPREFIAKYCAHYGVMPQADGTWTFKHHVRSLKAYFDECSALALGSCLVGNRCRAAFLYGTGSDYPSNFFGHLYEEKGGSSLDAILGYMRQKLAKEQPGGSAQTPMIPFEGGQHNFHTDHPEIFNPMLSAILLEWRRAEKDAGCTEQKIFRAVVGSSLSKL